MGDKIDITDLVANGKNSKQICCIRCKSKILPPQMGTYEVGSVFHVHPCGEDKRGHSKKMTPTLHPATTYL